MGDSFFGGEGGKEVEVDLVTGDVIQLGWRKEIDNNPVSTGT